MMLLQERIRNSEIILTEAAVVERLRRNPNLSFHHILEHSALIYDEKGRDAMRAIHLEYIDIAKKNDLPILLLSPTWRTNRERVEKSEYPDIVEDAVSFMKSIREECEEFASKIYIGGSFGCKNDCYLPEEALTQEDSYDFHQWQINKLSGLGLDFLIAETLPEINEALGIAKALSEQDLPYILSFVISRDGNILDGTSLKDAIQMIDNSVSKKPLGYTVNCAYPGFLNADEQDPLLFDRFIGYMANSSSLDHCDLEGASEVHADDLEDWGDHMVNLNKRHGVKMLGGCCGTGPEHLNYICDHL